MKLAFYWLFLLGSLAGQAFGANCSSNNSGTWNTPGIWSCGVTPTNVDNVTINNTHNVNLNGANRAAFSLVINTGGTLTTGSNSVTVGGGAPNNGVLTINGNVAGNGNAASRIIKTSTGNLTGSGTITNVNDVTISAATTISATNLQFTGAECRLDVSNGITVTNIGTLTFNSGACGTSNIINLGTTLAATFNNGDGTTAGTVTVGQVVGAAAGSTWTNDVGSSLVVRATINAPLLATGTLNASASGNTVHYNPTAAQNQNPIKVPTGGNFYHLTFSTGGTKTLAATTLNIAGNLTINTGVTVNANGNDPVINVSGNMVVAGTYTAASLAASKLTVTGDFSVSGTFTGGNSPIDLAGDFTNTGTYTTGAGIVTFNGGALQTLTGTTTITNMTVDNSGAGLMLASTITVGTTLTLTNGLVGTGAAVAVITSRACNAAGPAAVVRTNGWVSGNLGKTIPNNASTCTFEVGDASTYAPTVLTFVAGTGTGVIAASTTGTDHPSITSSGIDSTKSVNRYWTLSNVSVTLPAAGYSAVFNFVNGSPLDFDSGANTANFIIQRFTSNVWFAATLGGACAPTPVTYLCKQVTGVTTAAGISGAFAIGEPAAGFDLTPGDFSVFETSTGTGLIQGRIYTKVAGTTITLDVQAVNGARTGINAAYNTNPITVQLLDASDNTGALTAATNCRASWIPPPAARQISTQNFSPVWTNGRATITLTAPTSAGREVRVRVTQGALQGCSTDRFSIRPGFLRITSSNATQTNSSGTPAIKTGADFALQADGMQSNGTSLVSGLYTGTPAVDNTAGMIVGSPNQGTLGGTFNAATGVSATNSTFWYTEVGNFGLAADAIVDSGFTSLDQSGDCVSGSTSNTLSGGKYGCNVGSIAVAQTTGSSGFGRFIPDNFDVTTNFSIPSNTPAFAASCGTFTYMGQAFFYSASEPVMTVTARNGTAHGLTNGTTRNYAGAYVKLTNTTLAPAAYDTQGERYKSGGTVALDTTGLPSVTSDPVIFFPAASLTSGVGTLTFKTGTGGLTYARSTSTPSDAFDAEISLELNVVDGDNVVFAGNPAKFGATTTGNGISFNGNKPMRYGRLRLLNASGPTTVDIPLTLRAEYYVNAATGFVLNSADGCTTLAAGNFKLSGHTGSLTAGNMPNSNISVPANLTSGVASGMKLLKPTSAAVGPGSVKVCFDLDVTTASGDTSCQGASSSANQTYLQGPWTGTTATYDKDPIGQVNVGTFGSQPRNFIFFRENY